MVSASARLFVDFLLHEVAERAEFQRGQRHVRQVQRALGRRIVAVEDAHAIAAQFCGIAFFEEDHLAGGLHDRRHIGGDEVLALAYADQQRAAHPRANEAFRLGLAHHRQRVGAGEFLDGALQRGEQVAGAAQMVMDQMRDDFGVGLRLEGVAQRAQFFALLLVVFDDAVMHQRHAGADVRVRVGFGDAAMGGPAGVADAQRGAQLFGLRGLRHLGHPAGATHPAHLRAVEHCNAGGIVAAVFQALESLDQDRDHIAPGDRSDNAAHRTALAKKSDILACPLLSAA